MMVDEIQILGDSITGGRYGIGYGRFLKHPARLRGIDGQYMGMILDRALKCRRIPGCMVIQGGVNDIILGRCDETVVRQWADPLTELKSSVRQLLVCTLTPVGEDPSSPMNRIRGSINDSLRYMASEIGFHLVDIAKELDGELSGQGLSTSPLDLMMGDKAYLESVDQGSLQEASRRLSASRGFCVTVDGLHLGWDAAVRYAACLDRAMESFE
jgi:hypothetical protein